jgi:hypothetical protein
MICKFDEPLERLRTKWPQSFVASGPQGEHGDHLVVVPGVLLPPGYNKTICTVLFLSRPEWTQISEFWVDMSDLLLDGGTPPRRSTCCTRSQHFKALAARSWSRDWGFDGAAPCHSRRAGIWDGVPGFPEWSDVRLFLWMQMHLDPNHDDIFTGMMIVRQRLKLAR